MRMTEDDKKAAAELLVGHSLEGLLALAVVQLTGINYNLGIIASCNAQGNAHNPIFVRTC